MKRLLKEYVLKLLWVTLQEKLYLLEKIQVNEKIKRQLGWLHSLICFKRI